MFVLSYFLQQVVALILFPLSFFLLVAFVPIVSLLFGSTVIMALLACLSVSFMEGWYLPAFLPGGWIAARRMWITPLLLLSAATIFDARRFGLSHSIGLLLLAHSRPGSDEGPIVMALITIPMFSSIAYAIGALLRCRHSPSLCQPPSESPISIFGLEGEHK